MQRRKFIRNSFLSGAAVVTAGQSLAHTKNDLLMTEGKAFNMDYAFHAGMFKNNAGEDFLDQIKWAYDQGFRSIEDNGMMARPVELQKKDRRPPGKAGNENGCVRDHFGKLALEDFIDHRQTGIH